MFRSTESRSHTVLGALGLLLCLACLLVPALDSREFWVGDELRYAEVARQMSEYDHVLVPHINGQVYAQKPPLYFWAVMAVEHLVHDYRVAGRVIASLATAAAALALTLLARLLFSSTRLGILTATVFVTCFTPLYRAQMGLIDSFLLGISAWSILTLLWAAVAEVAWRRHACGIAASLLLLAAALTKGPVGVFLPIIAAVTVGLAWRGRRGIALGWILTGLGVASAGSLLWLYLAARQVGWWYWDYMLFHQVTIRTMGAAPHQEPLLFYVADSLPRGLLPWTLVLPGCFAVAWRLRHSATGRAALSLAGGGAILVLLFSLIPSKRSGYILPAYLLLAPVVALGFSSLEGARLRRWRVLGRWPLVLLAAAPACLALGTVLGTAGLPLIRSWCSSDTQEVLSTGMENLGAGLWFYATVAAILFAGLAVVALRGIRRGQGVHVLWAVAGTVVLASTIAHLSVVPAIDRVRSAQVFCTTVGQLRDRNEPLVLLGPYSYGELNYYAREEHYDVVSGEGLAARVQEPTRLWVFVETAVWKRMPEDLRTRFEPVRSGRVRTRRFVLLREATS